MAGEINQRKRLSDIDLHKLISEEDENPPELLVVRTAGEQSEQQRSIFQGGDGVEFMTDLKLADTINRQINLLRKKDSLSDKDQRAVNFLRRLQEEKKRREDRGVWKDDGGLAKSTQSHNQNLNGSTRDFRQGTPTSMAQSKDGLQFIKKQTECTTVDAFGQELTALGRCDRRLLNSNEQFSARGRFNSGTTFRETSFQNPSILSADVDKRYVSDGMKKDQHFSPRYPNIREDLCGDLSMKNASKIHGRKYLRPRKSPSGQSLQQTQTVVLVDEEEPQSVETVQQEEADEYMKDIKICYPSRDDPESVEICCADLECLAPATCLSSTIINFYIRYLQQSTSTTDSATCGYHFFTTYFYKKLKEAVLNKVTETDKLFVKFRRWWKGVNIFEKSYIFLPIHQCHHWSLVIIYILDKEDESGPILLHLDSARLHSSISIFNDIKSFLQKEWKYLNGKAASSDYPTADKNWHHLYFDERTIMVPQQKNEYDCGLFVLFFIERFIEKAPQRPKEKNLAMIDAQFGKQWFNPEEASDLRQKIRSLLMEKFIKETENRSVMKL